MEAIAKTKYLKGSPRKARLVIDLIRGQNVSKALAILKFTDKRAAQPIAKCLNSAIANATYLAEQQNIAIDPDDLWVNLCFVDMGPTKGRRRMRPAPQGRAYREQRHYCHITIQVSSETRAVDEEAAKKSAAAAERRAQAGDKKKTPKKTADKKAEVKETKAAAEEPVEEIAPVVETPVEETPAVETAAAETEAPAVEEAPAEEIEARDAVEAEEAKGDAEVADAKDAESHTAAEENETKPADEAQLDANEDVEKQ
jgi:large subunit ribosomal protein L22